MPRNNSVRWLLDANETVYYYGQYSNFLYEATHGIFRSGNVLFDKIGYQPDGSSKKEPYLTELGARVEIPFHRDRIKEYCGFFGSIGALGGLKAFDEAKGADFVAKAKELEKQVQGELYRMLCSYEYMVRKQCPEYQLLRQELKGDKRRAARKNVGETDMLSETIFFRRTTEVNVDALIDNENITSFKELGERAQNIVTDRFAAQNRKNKVIQAELDRLKEKERQVIDDLIALRKNLVTPGAQADTDRQIRLRRARLNDGSTLEIARTNVNYNTPGHLPLI